MGIRDNSRFMIDISKNQIRNFSSDSRECQKLLHIVRNMSAEPFADNGGKPKTTAASAASARLRAGFTIKKNTSGE